MTSARPRILGVIASSVPGGAESVFSTLLHGVAGRFEPFVVCDDTGVMVERYRASASDLVATPMNAPTHLAASRVIARLIDRWSIDLVHTHLWNADLFGACAAASRGCPVVSTVHGSNFLPMGSQGLHRFRRQGLSLSYRAVYRLCDRVIAPSQALRDDLVRRPGLRVPADRIIVVPNGIDIETTLERTAAASLPEAITDRMGVPLVACIANMFAIKGHEWLVRAFSEIVSAEPKAVLALVGDGEARAEIEHLVRELGLTDRVVFTGSVANPLAIVRRADVCVLPSLSEGLPIALLEAMLLERAVVATHVGGIPDVVQDGQNGVLVPPADPHALSQAIVRLLRDPDSRARLGAEARRSIERDWSSARMVEGTAAVYDDVLARRAGRRRA